MKPRTSTSLCRPWETSSLLWLKERSVTLLTLSLVLKALVFLRSAIKSVAIMEIHLLNMLWWCSVGFSLLICTVSKSELSDEMNVFPN